MLGASHTHTHAHTHTHTHTHKEQKEHGYEVRNLWQLTKYGSTMILSFCGSQSPSSCSLALHFPWGFICSMSLHMQASNQHAQRQRKHRTDYQAAKTAKKDDGSTGLYQHTTHFKEDSTHSVVCLFACCLFLVVICFFSVTSCHLGTNQLWKTDHHP